MTEAEVRNALAASVQQRLAAQTPRFRITRVREGWLYEDHLDQARIVFRTRAEARSFKAFMQWDEEFRGRYTTDEAVTAWLDGHFSKHFSKLRRGLVDSQPAEPDPLVWSQAAIEASRLYLDLLNGRAPAVTEAPTTRIDNNSPAIKLHTSGYAQVSTLLNTSLPDDPVTLETAEAFRAGFVAQHLADDPDPPTWVDWVILFVVAFVITGLIMELALSAWGLGL